MKLPALLVASALLLTAVDVRAQLLRTVEGQVLTSPELPAVRLEVDPTFAYAGGQSFVLAGVARAEQHLFVEAGENGHVQRLWWFQFEGYLPDAPHAYDYSDDPERRSLGGHEWTVRPIVTRVDHSDADPPSDGDMAEALLRSKGYALPDEIAGVRLVRLLGDDRRNELMIIYMEDLALEGGKLAELNAERRAAIASAVVERAVSGLRVADIPE